MFSYLLLFLQVLKSKSLILTILANLSVLAGVIFFDWKVGNIILLYYFESIVSIYFNYKKILNNQNPNPPKLYFNQKLVTNISEIKKLLAKFSIEFYLLAHFIYLPFVVILFIPGLIDLHANFKGILFQILSIICFSLINLLFLFFSYFYEYKNNYILNDGDKAEYLGKLFGAPMKRTLIMHATVVVAGFGLNATNRGQIAIIIFVLLKTIVDVVSFINLKNNLLKPYNKTILITKVGNSTTVSYE